MKYRDSSLPKKKTRTRNLSGLRQSIGIFLFVSAMYGIIFVTCVYTGVARHVLPVITGMTWNNVYRDDSDATILISSAIAGVLFGAGACSVYALQRKQERRRTKAVQRAIMHARQYQTQPTH